MRKRVGSVIIKIFVVLLVLGFGAWGVQDMLGYQVGGGSNDVAVVGGEDLSGRGLYSDVYGEINRMREFMGNSFNIEKARQLGVVDAVLERQINSAAIRIGARELGIAISDALVREAVLQEPMFRGLAGNFDGERFKQILKSNGLTEKNYIARVREDLVRQQLVNTLNAGVIVPARLVDQVYSFREETRDVEIGFVADSAVPEISGTGDVELREYYTKHKKMFTAPAYRAVDFVRLNAADLARNIEISDDNALKAYSDRLDEFTLEERRNIRQILLSDEVTAKTAEEKVKKGEDFLDVAQEVANQDKETAELGILTRGDLLPDLADPVFQLSMGGISAPIKSSLGWHVMQVVAITPGKTKSFDEVKAEVKEALALQKAIDAIFDISNRFEDELAGGASLAEAASRLGLKVEKLGALDRAGNDSSGEAIANLPLGDFVGTAFSAIEGEDSAMIESGDDGFYILNVTKVTPPALRPFSSVKDQVAAAWKSEKRREGAQSLAAVIVGAVGDGKKLEDGPSGWNIKIRSVLGVRRQGNQPEKIGNKLAQKVFKLKLGEAAMERVGNGYEIAVLKKIISAPVGPSESKKNVESQIVQSIRNDLNSQLVAGFRKNAGVSINRRAIDMLFGNTETAKVQ